MDHPKTPFLIAAENASKNAHPAPIIIWTSYLFFCFTRQDALLGNIMQAALDEDIYQAIRHLGNLYPSYGRDFINQDDTFFFTIADKASLHLSFTQNFLTAVSSLTNADKDTINETISNSVKTVKAESALIHYFNTYMDEQEYGYEDEENKTVRTPIDDLGVYLQQMLPVITKLNRLSERYINAFTMEYRDEHDLPGPEGNNAIFFHAPDPYNYPYDEMLDFLVHACVLMMNTYWSTVGEEGYGALSHEEAQHVSDFGNYINEVIRNTDGKIIDTLSAKDQMEIGEEIGTHLDNMVGVLEGQSKESGTGFILILAQCLRKMNGFYFESEQENTAKQLPKQPEKTVIHGVDFKAKRRSPS